MKRFGLLLCAALALLFQHPVAHAQYQPINCALSTACNPSTGPTNTGTGYPLWKVGGVVNSEMSQIYAMFGAGAHLNTAGTVIVGDITGLFTCSNSTYALTYGGGCAAPGVSTSATNTWTAVQTFTNSDFCLLGSSTGCTTFTSANSSATNYTLTFPAVTDTVVTLAATQTLTGKSIAASEVNSGTLAAAQMPALTGDVTSSAGTVATTVVKVNGASVPTSASLLGTNSSGQLISATAGIQSIATGIIPLGTPIINSGTCATAVTGTATGAYTSDSIDWGFNGDPTAATGYAPSSGGMLTIISYPTPNAVNFKVCNNTGSSITPTAVSINWYIQRSTGPIVAFVQAITPWGGTTSPQVSGSFTPITYSTSDVLIGHAFGSAAGAISVSGTSGTWNILSQSSDGHGNQYAALDNTTSTTTSQTETLTQSATTALFGRIWEYTHTSSISGSLIQRSSPGSSAGGLVGTSLSVPNGGVLLCAVTDVSGGAIAYYNGTSRGSNTAFATAEYTNTTGSTASMQCAFTAVTGTDVFDIEQWVLSP